MRNQHDEAFEVLFLLPSFVNRCQCQVAFVKQTFARTIWLCLPWKFAMDDKLKHNAGEGEMRKDG